MSVIYVALPIAILLGAGGLAGCLYCIRSGQYEDLDSPPVRILIEDDSPLETDEGVRSHGCSRNHAFHGRTLSPLR